MATFSERLVLLINFLLVPLRLAIPQPVIEKIPLLKTNREERFGRVLAEYRGKALDIGCRHNVIIKKYRELGNCGEGVDIYHWDGADLIVEDTSRLPYESETFDTVSIVASLNHIPNRIDVLKEAHRLLRRDGRLVITNLTPFVSKVWHVFCFWDREYAVRGGLQEGEVWGFTDKQLMQLVEAAGFRLIKKSGFLWGLNHLYVFGRNRVAS